MFRRNLVTFGLVILMAGCGDSSKVDLVKNGILEMDKSRTVGEALQGYKDCKSISWNYLKDEKNIEYITAKCDLTDTIKTEFKSAKDYYKKENLDLLSYYISRFSDNDEHIISISKEFVFVVNRDDTFTPKTINTNMVFDKNKTLSLKSSFDDNKTINLMKKIYEKGTLVKNKWSDYLIEFEKTITQDSEIFKLFGFNPVDINFQENMIGKFNIKDIFNSLFACDFSENKLLKGMYPNNGYFIEFKNESCDKLNNPINSVSLEADDNGIVQQINLKIDDPDRRIYKMFVDGGKAAYKILSQEEKVVGDQYAKFKIDDNTTAVIFNKHMGGFVTNVIYYSNEHNKKVLQAKQKNN
ncbi:hypothetical protein A9K75_06750 [Campylobacter fetus subsp. testudinum]|uniref:hypothetical protein n=1 Tax=Campylobacter fetus TaxID=196 RepID=UPI0008188D03|nr:hypothetical protein [Campylobacter fetus]OCR99564.1 hypothetical protein A9K75_06750 [Campylobacter fetus subsp. testudinum]